jgi:hypothetical protein
LVADFKQAAKLHYSVTKKEALELTFEYDKENGVIKTIPFIETS